MESRLPNRIQKWIHGFLMWGPISAFLAVVLYRVDSVFLKLTGGRHALAEAVGLPIIQLTTIGARTGLPRTMPLVGIVEGERILLIGSNFGRKHNPGWIHNLQANPMCIVRSKGRSGEYRARFAQGRERDHYWRLAVAYYRGYEQYKLRAAPQRVVPVVVLEPAGRLSG